MAKITLTGGFKPLDEGIYVFKIVSCEYKEDFGKLNFTLETKDGRKVFNNYNFGVGNAVNEGAINAFSFFARTVTGRPDLDECDPEELIGKYVRGECVHSVGTTLDSEGNPKTFANLKNWEYADGFDNAAPKSTGIDLDDILG